MLRGITAVADVTEELLAPDVALLPAPFQSGVRFASAAIENVGARAVTPTIDLAEIRQSSAFLRGTDKDRRSAEALVNVLAFGWQRALRDRSITHLLFSETVADASIADRIPATAGTPYERAATVLAELRRAHAVGRIPGFPLVLSDSQRERVDQTLLAIFVWLLADRASSVAEEECLLRWSFALVHSHSEDVAHIFATRASLAARLQYLAEHL